MISQEPGCPFAIVVMENDADGLEGAEAAKSFFADHRINALVVIAHQRGNCHAYNAGWAMALATYPNLQAIAVIDDDEIAAPDWLDSLISVHRQTQGRPRRRTTTARFRRSRPATISKRHPVFMPHYETTGPVPILYSSGNVLITRPVLDAMPRPFLDPVFNFIGGGDSDFYRRCEENGFTFAWASGGLGGRNDPGAADGNVVDQGAKPEERRDLGAARTSRGAGVCRSREDDRQIAGAACAPRRFAAFHSGDQPSLPSAGLYHFYVAWGRLMMEFGLVNEQYRNPEKN